MTKIVNFYNNSTGSISSYSWNFGSGALPQTAIGIGPHAVSYDTTGLKTVSLTATGPDGVDTKVKVDYILVIFPSPIADYSWFVDSTNPKAVHFTDLTLNVPDSWDWAWNDGSSNGTDKNPIHIFPNYDSTYSVTLTASNPGGSDSITKSVTTGHSLINPPIADFAWSVNGIDVRRIDFTDLSLNSPTSWDWTWGDGSSHGTTQNPYHTYADYDTTYAVTLNATNITGTDDTTINVVTGHYFFVDYSWGQLPEV
jgi:PKD repeat protein